jgi:hypothetical protein
MTHLPVALRICLVGLVLTNLVHVHLTRAVDGRWMLPLYALALLAPVLSRFAQRRVCRLAWNGAVLAIFALLLRHASQAGVHRMLEDGLILAAFCQVHLLNNLTERQKPDLLFFNSFLVALVTSFFCQDLLYSLVFVVQAALLIVGLQLVAGARSGAAPRGLALDGLRRAAAVLALTMGGFLLLPRDFDREGLLTEELAESGLMRAGFNERVELGRSGRTAISNRVVLRVHLREGRRDAVPAHWRGATCTHFDRRGWHTDQRPQSFGGLDAPWEGNVLGGWSRPGFATAARLEVEVVQSGSMRLFAPLHSHRVHADIPPIGFALADGTFQIVAALDARRAGGQLTYDVDVHAAGDDPARPLARRDAGLDLYLHVDRRLFPATARTTAREVARALPAAADRRTVAAALCARLARHPYLLPGAQGAADDLEAFLDGGAGGHCEYFATALALMLRSQGIPCRIVTGYCSNEWDDEGRVLTIRSSHAHAWVEVLDTDGRWFVADATPAASLSELGLALPWWEWLQNGAQSLWAKVTRFDTGDRAAALAWVRALPGRLGRQAAANPLGALLIALALGAVAVWLRRRRRQRRSPAAHAYLAALRRAGLEVRCGETPRETLARARGAALTEQTLAALVTATEAHERARYGAAPPA